MKRIFILLLAAILLCAALPCEAEATETETTTFDADRVLIYNPLPYVKNGNGLMTGTVVQEQTANAAADGRFVPGLHSRGSDYASRGADDTRAFWICTDLNTYRYDKCTFRLAAESEHCYIWMMPDDAVQLSEEQLARMTEQFENVIYPTDTGRFGPFRDLSGDGKLHIIAYAMNSLAVCGFFDTYDLYSAEEIAAVDPDDAESYNCLPIININTRMADDETTVLCTLAHEFQHLILRSAVLASPANADRLGSELDVGTWLNEGFSMAAEELCYPGAVAEQGYLGAFAGSDKVKNGMSYCNFDTSASDVSAYGQSFLFAQYLKAQFGEDVFKTFLDYWREAREPEDLTVASAIESLMTDEQRAAYEALAAYTDGVTASFETEHDELLSKFALGFHLAVAIKQPEGMFSIGEVNPEKPVYSGTNRRLEGGGALLVEANGSYTIPKDAEAGLVFVTVQDGEVTGSAVSSEPEEGFYVIAAERDGTWYAIPAEPTGDRTIRPVTIAAPENGTVRAENVNGAIFCVTREADGYRIACDDLNGSYALTRTDTSKQMLAIRESDTCFNWMHFADGGDRLQADGYYGRAILYGEINGGFGYFAQAYFNHVSFSHPRLLKVSIRKGDANLDGSLTAADASIVLRSIVQLSYLNAPMREAADYNRDGDVSAADAAKILRVVVQLEPEE